MTVGHIQMEEPFRDISKYYAANIVENVLTIGKIIHAEHGYTFARDDVQGPFNLVEPDSDVTRIVQVIGEIHPKSALEKIMPVKVQSCLYLNENEKSGEIEVRPIHKGMGTSIFSRQQCPLILWNPNYQEHKYFDVMDIQGVFSTSGMKDSFTSIIAESLREFELFPPLLHMKK